MSLSLNNKFKIRKNLNFKRVTDHNKAKMWSISFHKAFGYKISTEIILKRKNPILSCLL